MRGQIGIVACSPPGAALCFETVCALSREIVPVDVAVHAHDFDDYMRFVSTGDWSGVADLMVSSAEKLARIGATILVAPCNTIHAAFEIVQPRSPLPWLHIAEVVATEARRLGILRLGVLGTRALMEGDTYTKKLHAVGIAAVIPDSDTRQEVDRRIFDELVRGHMREETLQYFRAVVEQLRGRGCDAVGLCCTELPVLFRDVEVQMPLLDSVRLLAGAAVRNCANA